MKASIAPRMKLGPRDRTRSWPGVTVCRFERPAREARAIGREHRLNLQLAPVPNALVQVESGRPRLLTIASLSFVPAGVAVRTVMGAGTSIGVLQAPASYDGIGDDLALPGPRGFEPRWDLEDPTLATLVRLLLAEADSPFRDHLFADALNRAIAIQLLRGLGGENAQLPRPGRLARERLARVVDYIDAHLDGPLSLADIAAEARLSPFHFSRCFKQSLGISLANFVARRCIERAKELLRSPRPLAEIALAVGFETQASFTARFHRETGLSPGRFRKQL